MLSEQLRKNEQQAEVAVDCVGVTHVCKPRRKQYRHLGGCDFGPKQVVQDGSQD